MQVTFDAHLCKHRLSTGIYSVLKTNENYHRWM